MTDLPSSRMGDEDTKRWLSMRRHLLGAHHELKELGTAAEHLGTRDQIRRTVGTVAVAAPRVVAGLDVMLVGLYASLIDGGWWVVAALTVATGVLVAARIDTAMKAAHACDPARLAGLAEPQRATVVQAWARRSRDLGIVASLVLGAGVLCAVAVTWLVVPLGWNWRWFVLAVWLAALVGPYAIVVLRIRDARRTLDDAMTTVDIGAALLAADDEALAGLELPAYWRPLTRLLRSHTTPPQLPRS